LSTYEIIYSKRNAALDDLRRSPESDKRKNENRLRGFKSSFYKSTLST